ncbi:MAG: ATP-binding protein [Desulfobacterota bacterium]|nr:ATP-binding protein [Thermodesulfobacteriota bacterium]MDW8002223.1 ATP-binding protein [Deltaproteobacteria bacterium]
MEDEIRELVKNKERLELVISEEKELSEVRRKLLEKSLKEMEELYASLKEKLEDLKQKDLKIREIAEKLERANKLSLMGEITGAIAHQIKNPLIAIQGFAKRIQDTENLDKIKSYAKIILESAEKLTEVLSRLLEFSRMENPKKEWININRLILDTLGFFEHHLTRFKKIELNLELAENLPDLHVDKIHIQQVLANLLVNAAQAMPDGGPIVIKTGKDDEGVYFAVIDRGKGIPEEVRDKLFEPFYTTKPKNEGTGLGLAICKRLVEANGGRISFETEEGRGTKFFVHFPVGQNSNSIPS